MGGVRIKGIVECLLKNKDWREKFHRSVESGMSEPFSFSTYSLAPEIHQ